MSADKFDKTKRKIIENFKITQHENFSFLRLPIATNRLFFLLACRELFHR
jgi:hypothetical protein